VGDEELWARIEAGIKWEEERVRKEREVELKKRLEEEKARAEREREIREEEERRRAEEQRKREEEERLTMERERAEEAERKEQEMAIARKEAERAEEEERRALGMSTAEEDWKHARVTLKVPSFIPPNILFTDPTLPITETQIRPNATRQIHQTAKINMVLPPTANNAQDRSTHQRPHLNQPHLHSTSFPPLPVLSANPAPRGNIYPPPLFPR
jgi:nucleoporin GLE1